MSNLLTTLTKSHAYYNDFDPANPPERVLYRSDRVLQSRELNETQSALINRIRGLGDAIYKDGDVYAGAQIIVNPETGETLCENGVIYLAGAMRGVPRANLTIPVVGIVHVGIYLTERIATETEDPSLLNPAVGTRGYKEPGAARYYIDTWWGVGGEEGEFYPVWTVEDGYVRSKEPPPNMDGVTQALARYDRDSAGGTYIVMGLTVARAADLATGEQVYTLSEGRARVNGYAVEQQASRRIVYATQPDLRYIDSEPHQSLTADRQRITYDRAPAHGRPDVRITARKTVTVIHGGTAGTADPLPDGSVLQIESVKQAEKTYTPVSDYKLTAGQIDWSPTGAEPAVGSSYTVTYQYLSHVDPGEYDPTGFEIEGALPGTQIFVTYNQQMRRIDRLCLDQEGSIVWIRGEPGQWSPAAPKVPSHLLLLASVYQRWDDSTRVVQDGVKVVSMSDLAGLSRRLDEHAINMAEMRLALDINGRDFGIKKGSFADPFLSDDMRDKGVPQTAAIVGGGLRLPISAVVHHVGLDMTTAQTLAHTHRIVIDQPMRTGSMQVNPYMAFRPLPAITTLSPQVDRWTEINVQWTSAVTERFYTGSGSQQRYAGASTTTRIVSESRSELEFLRPISVRFDLQGFGPGETLATVLFDGIAVTPAPLSGSTLTASESGKLSGTFTVPQKVPSGTKEVVFRGSGGSEGSQFFTGQGTSVLRTQQQVTTEKWVNSNPTPPSNPSDDMIVAGPYEGDSWGSMMSGGCEDKIVAGPSTDPLAQTFTVQEPTQMSGVRLIFTDKSTEVVVQIREVQLGLPTSVGLVEQRVPVESIKVGEIMTISWPPVTLQPNREYAIVVLCDDAKPALSIAELGKWDAGAKQWVTSQPYQVGVLLSSSNANTWTSHQDRDMTFSVLAPHYTETERVVDLGAVELVDATDLLILGYAEIPSADCGVVFEVVFPPRNPSNPKDQPQTVQLSDGQVVWLREPMTCPVKVQARIRGSSRMAAVLQPGIQLIAGTIAEEADYVTRTVTAGDNCTIKVIYEAVFPAGSSVRVHVQDSDTPAAQWVEVPYIDTTSSTAGVAENIHQLDGFSADRCRVRLTLKGSTTARPSIHNLKVVVL